MINIFEAFGVACIIIVIYKIVSVSFKNLKGNHKPIESIPQKSCIPYQTLPNLKHDQLIKNKIVAIADTDFFIPSNYKNPILNKLFIEHKDGEIEVVGYIDNMIGLDFDGLIYFNIMCYPKFNIDFKLYDIEQQLDSNGDVLFYYLTNEDK